MTAVIDTSSLLALVRYYMPFDKNGLLKALIKDKVVAHEWIILDKVVEESGFVSKGKIIKVLDFLKKEQIKTENFLPNPKFFNQLDSQFCYGAKKNEMTIPEFENEKRKYLNSADAKELLFCIKNIDGFNFNDCMLVTEESSSDNDSKLFKKLPQICNMLNVVNCDLPVLFKEYYKLDFGQLFN
jgi:hypothetical protein